MPSESPHPVPGSGSGTGPLVTESGPDRRPRGFRGSSTNTRTLSYRALSALFVRFLSDGKDLCSGKEKTKVFKRTELTLTIQRIWDTCLGG